MLRLLAALALLASGGARAEPDAGKSYEISTKGSTATVRAGGEGRIVLALEPLAKVHVDPRAPLKITLSATPGLALGKERLAFKDAVDPKAEMPRFEVPFVAKAKGPQEAKAKLDFFLCSDEWCVKQTREVAVAVDVR
jgi:hypothetical protein